VKNLSLLILAAASFALAVFAWIQHRELAELRTRKADENAVEAVFEKRLAAAQDNVRELEKQLDELRTGALAQQKSGALVPPAGDPSSMSWMTGLASFIDRPEMQRMFTTQQRLAIERRFARLFKQLNLPPEQQEKFKALLLEQQTAAMDTFIVAAQKGLNPMQNEAELSKLAKDAQGDVDRQIKELLGDASYSQYDSFRKAEPQRAVVAQLQQNLSYDDEPLTRDQSEKLAQVLSATSGTGRASRISEEAIAQTRSFLSPSQTKALEELRQTQLQHAELRRGLLPPAPSGGKP
jgi:hypothetical protein